MTTDEGEILLELPMDNCDISSKLMPNCDYIITDWDSNIIFENTDDVIKLNEIISKINTENPALTLKSLCAIYEASDYKYLEDEDFVEKLCNNDFMYEEIDMPSNGILTCEEYAAYILFTKYNIPTSPITCEQGILDIEDAYGDDFWSVVWDIYQFMGFRISEDEEDLYKIYIVNMEDSDDVSAEYYAVTEK